MNLVKIIKKNWALGLLGSAYLVIYLWQKPIGRFLAQGSVQNLIGRAVYQGWLGLVDYLSAHVLFCLVPAFFIAGAINSLIDSQSILKYLSGKTKKWLAYLIAVTAGFLIEVCSCTILPLFAGIWKKGAGLGIAIALLYAGPAFNIVTILFTGQRIGWEFSIVRFVLSVAFAILVGLIMEVIFGNGREDGSLEILTQDTNKLKGSNNIWFWGTMLAILVVGTAPINNNLRYTLIIPLVLLQIIMSFSWLSKENRTAWWEETTKFIGQIVPLLLVGVFLAAAITQLIPEEQFQTLASQNNVLTNFIAVMFGTLAYFPALVEVPIAENFMKLGMSKGPLMAYMLADPVLSLQGLLVIRKLIGTKKMLVYAISIVILTTLAGFIYGLI
ncbi:permease [Patescibacteria group bacterium]|nr:permease [Patescibacteria group bacterium]MBU1868165.1 permease [Patescibacteria group bacterium]